MNDNELENNQKAIEDYDKRQLKDEKDEKETERIQNVLDNLPYDEVDKKEGGFWSEGSAFRTTAAIGTEVAANTLLDLFSFEPTSQVGGAAAINYFAQLIRGGEISHGEAAAAGLASLIPGGAQAKSLGGVLAKGAAKGAVTGAVETGVADLIDTRQVNPENLAFGALVGGGFGSAFSLVGSQPEVQRAVKYFKGRIRGDAKISPEDAIDLGLGQPMAYMTPTMSKFPTAKQLLTELPKGASFDTDEVNNYATRAFVYRDNRVMQGGKQNLMKGFDETLKNKSGQEFIFVRRSTPRNRDNPAAIENYKLKSVSAVERKLIRSLGFDKQIPEDVKALKTIVSELNKLEQQNPKLYLSSLMEYGDKAYLEHKVARSQFEDFWARVEARNPQDIDNNLFQWTGARGRNTVENLRLLLDPNYKTLKDAVETRFVNSDLYKSAPGRQSQPDDIVISIEDPGSTTFGANNMFVRSNPGNIQFRKAGTGEVVGSIPDYYRQFYSRAFKEGYEKNYGFLANPNNPAVPEKFRAKAGESVDQYRKRVINARIDEAMSGNFDMQNFEANYLEEIAQFYDLFHDKLGWVRLPSWANNIITGKTKFADRLQVEIDDFEIENAPRSPVVAPKTLKQSNLDEALQEIRDLERDIRNLARDPVKLPKGTQGFTPDTQVIDTKTGKAAGKNYGQVQSNLRKLKRELQERIDAIKAEYGIDQEKVIQQSLDLE